MTTYNVYEHVFPNGKRYIGITCQTPARRWAGGSGYKDCPKMRAAISKYGWGNIEHAVLYEGLTKTEAEARERDLIAYYNTTKSGYNIELGGNAPGTHSEETKQKISAGGKGKKKPQMPDERKRRLSETNSGEGNPFYGRHHTIETRETHSDFMKQNTYFKGHHHTDEYKRTKSEQMREIYKDGSPRSRAIVMRGTDGAEKVFRSMRQAATSAGVSVSAMFKAVHNNTELNQCYWRFADE